MSNTSIPVIVEKLWKDIEEWYVNNNVEGHEQSSEGYSEADILAFEKILGASLPEDYKSSLKARQGAIEVYAFTYLTLKDVIRKWKLMNSFVDREEFKTLEIIDPESDIIQKVWWHSGFIPFAADSGGNLLCIDIKPGPKGIHGQIVHWDTVEGPSPTKHKSFLAWLQTYKQDLFEGKYVVDTSGYLKKNTQK